MNKNLIASAVTIYLSKELTDSKLDKLFELIVKENVDINIDLKKAKKELKKINNTFKIRALEDGNIDVSYWVSQGCSGDWTEREVVSPTIFYYKYLVPNNINANETV